MTHCRRLMLEELQRRNFAPTTISSYLHAVEQFAAGAASLRAVKQGDHFVPAITDDAGGRLTGVRFGVSFGQDDDSARHESDLGFRTWDLAFGIWHLHS